MTVLTAKGDRAANIEEVVIEVTGNEYGWTSHVGKIDMLEQGCLSSLISMRSYSRRHLRMTTMPSFECVAEQIAMSCGAL